MRPAVDYFFAPQSPWTCLGHDRFCALLARYDAAVRVLPCDLARIFAVSGGLPLAQRAPQRQAYRLIELRRFAQHLGIALTLHPRFFPVTNDHAARLIVAATEHHDEAAALRLAGALGRALWCDDRDIADAATLTQIATECALDSAALIALLHSEAVAARYEANTEEAIERQVFGAPTYLFEGEPFWGQDRLDLLGSALARHVP